MDVWQLGHPGGLPQFGNVFEGRKEDGLHEWVDVRFWQFHDNFQSLKNCFGLYHPLYEDQMGTFIRFVFGIYFDLFFGFIVADEVRHMVEKDVLEFPAGALPRPFEIVCFIVGCEGYFLA